MQNCDPKRLEKTLSSFKGLAAAHAPQLAAFAKRLFRTPNNSVPSERAFSAMKLNSGKYRATMKLEKLDKLYFIHINRRILDRGDKKHNTFTKFYTELTDEQAVDLENDLEAVNHAELINALTKGLERGPVEDKDGKSIDRTARPRVHPSTLPLPAIHTFFRAPTVT